MPPTRKHFETSFKRTGKDYAALHGWIDDANNKNERHDFTLIWDFATGIKEQYGEEGVREYIEHLREDMETKFGKIRGQYQDSMKDAYAYFGIKGRGSAMVDYQIEQRDIALLRVQGMVETDIDHSIKVAEKSLEIARRTNSDLDMKLVGRSALFHDLGKAKTHAIEHGRVGAELGEKIGLPETITGIMEKHIRGGLTADEAKELGLPVKDYFLKRLEERIVIYADRLVDIITEGIVDIGNNELEAEERFEEILKKYPKYGKNEKTLNRYLGYHQEIQGLMKK